MKETHPAPLAQGVLLKIRIRIKKENKNEKILDEFEFIQYNISCPL